MKLTVNGRAVAATTGGTEFDVAKPAVIFLHGAGFDRTTWRLQTRWFAHHGRSVLAVDFPGHGWSEGPALDSVAAMADWTAALIGAAGLKSAALVGHSMGALVAVDTAARFPDKVRALGLCGVASEMPVLIAVPRPRLTVCWTTAKCMSRACSRITSAVPSVEPSSTMITRAPNSRATGARSASSLGMFSASL